MSLRILLLVAGIIALIFGLYFLLLPNEAIQEFQSGSPDPALVLSVREFGGALISLAVIDGLSSADRGSKALRAVLAGNIVFFLFTIGLDFTGSFPATGIWYVVTVVKLLLILAFAYYLFRGVQSAGPAAMSGS